MVRTARAQLDDILNNENYDIECDEVNNTNIHDIVNDLIDASVLINNIREEIGQLALTYNIGGIVVVCNNILEQTKEYAE